MPHLGSSRSFVVPNLDTMPGEVSLRIIQYVDDENHRDILALERTCRAFWILLKDDKHWDAIASTRSGEFQYPPTSRERAFLWMSLRNIRKFQKGGDNLVLEYLGEADGIRRLMGLLLDAMKPPGIDRLIPIIRGDAIEYLTEVIQCNAIYRMQKALTLVVGTLRPGDGYPTITAKDLRLLDGLFHATPDGGNGYLHCSVVDKVHVCDRVFSANGGDDPNIHQRWKWPEHDCQDNNFLGQEERRKLVRALAYRAGITKMSGEAFSILSTEILHDMAVLLYSAFDLCNEERGDVTMEESDDEKSDDGVDNEPLPMIDGLGEADAMETGGRQSVNVSLYGIDAAEQHEDNTIVKCEDETPLSVMNCLDRDNAKVLEGPPGEGESEFVIVPCHNKDEKDGHEDSSDEMDDYISGEDNMKMMEGSLNYCANYCSSGGYKFVIIPRHIKDAAALMGMRPILGFGIFGAEWAAEDEEFRNEEIEGVFDQYFSDTTEDSESED
jgi:hypothetical protein